MNTLRSSGPYRNYTATGAVTAGIPKVIGKVIYVPQSDGVAGDRVNCLIKGVFAIKRTPAVTAVAEGALVYLTATGAITATAAGNTFAGVLAEACATSAVECNVDINFGGGG